MTQNAGGIPNFESGQVVLFTGDVKVLKVDLTSKHIDVDIEDKQFVKRIIAMREDLTPKMPQSETTQGTSQVGNILSTVRSVTETICKQGITITVSYRGKRIATIGEEAHPILLHHILKTKGIALNSIFTAIKMII
jgi:hypothetical protein